MERLDGNVGALQGTLQQAPEVLAAVGVDLTVNIPLSVVDDVVDVVSVQTIIREQFVGVDLGATAHVLAHSTLQNMFAVALNDRQPNGAMATIAMAREQ